MFLPLTAASTTLPDLSTLQWIFVFSNAIIPIGYLFIAFFVLPILPVSHLTRWGARAFFILCSLTHIDQLLHVFVTPNETYFHITGEIHMTLIHAPQAIAVWVFALGFFLDLNRLRNERGNVEAAVKHDARD